MREPADVVYLSDDEEGAVEPDARYRSYELGIVPSVILVQQLGVDVIDLFLDVFEAVQT